MQLSKEIKFAIGGMITLEEIMDALWSMKSYKAPSPDGSIQGFSNAFGSWLGIR